VAFHRDSGLHDPYDGLVIEPRPASRCTVHDCMGVRAGAWKGQRWGLLTLDGAGARHGSTRPGAPGAGAAAVVLVEAVGAHDPAGREWRCPAAQAVAGGSEPGADADDGLRDDADELEVVGRERCHRAPCCTKAAGRGRQRAAGAAAGRDRRRQGTVRAPAAPPVVRRAAKPLVQVNCAALPEIPGRERAVRPCARRVLGRHQRARRALRSGEGGTLFLDEVGELPLAACRPSCCARCRTARSSAWAPTRPSAVDVRVIAATNRDLKRRRCATALFRADLYHRLSVYPLPIPPLRERGKDVLPLAGRFLELNRARLGLRSLRLSSRVATQQLTPLPLAGQRARAGARAWAAPRCKCGQSPCAPGAATSSRIGARRARPAGLTVPMALAAPDARGGCRCRRPWTTPACRGRCAASVDAAQRRGHRAGPWPRQAGQLEARRPANWSSTPATCTSWPGGWGSRPAPGRADQDI
jgi:hypothetical protein